MVLELEFFDLFFEVVFFGTVTDDNKFGVWVFFGNSCEGVEKNVYSFALVKCGDCGDD